MKVKINHYLIIAFLSCILVFCSPVVTAKNSYFSSDRNYLEEGKQLYDRGSIDVAINIWQQAIKYYRKKQDIRQQSIAYNYLAIAYQDIGKWSNSQRAINNAIEFLEKDRDDFIFAQILNTKGNLEAKTGELEKAIVTWQTAENIYRDLDAVEPLLRVKINQAQAYRTLGYGLRSQNILEEVNQNLAALPDSILKVRALQSLGISLRNTGKLEDSSTVLNKSLTLARQLNFNNINSIQFSLANTLAKDKKFTEASLIYQQIRENTKQDWDKVKAGIHLIDIWLKIGEQNTVRQILPTIINELNTLPRSIEKTKLEINLAANLIDGNLEINNYIPDILNQGITQARQTNNLSLETLATGKLGLYYEQKQQLQQAQTATKKALLLANNSYSSDLLPQLYWQQARIFQQEDKIDKALVSFQQAIENLQSLRQDITAISPEIQFSFRQKVEPIYRQYVRLLLQDIDKLDLETQQKNLINARNAIESLQLAELENFFRESCITTEPKPLEEIDPNAAIIYPIIIENSLEVILSLPGKPLQHYGTTIDDRTKDNFLRNIYLGLNRSTSSQTILEPAQQLYDWLIRPGKLSLESQNIETIVFVLDDWLRNLPLSVLHDRESYLIEKYNLALTPGLQLLESRKIPSEELNILTVGISQARQGFAPLPSVTQEINQITNLTKSTVLVDDKFTLPNFQNRVTTDNYSIVHIATHGQFSSDIKNTFLLAWDDKLNIQDISQLLQNRESDRQNIELLVLSACETAAGDNRATLGMAGIAVRSGARSTIGSLWRVSDRSTTELMSNFYQFLSQNKTKSEALRQAQLSLINNSKYTHPYYWSPFTLIGNWQ